MTVGQYVDVEGDRTPYKNSEGGIGEVMEICGVGENTTARVEYLIPLGKRKRPDGTMGRKRVEDGVDLSRMTNCLMPHKGLPLFAMP